VAFIDPEDGLEMINEIVQFLICLKYSLKLFGFDLNHGLFANFGWIIDGREAIIGHLRNWCRG